MQDTTTDAGGARCGTDGEGRDDVEWMEIEEQETKLRNAIEALLARKRELRGGRPEAGTTTTPSSASTTTTGASTQQSADTMDRKRKRGKKEEEDHASESGRSSSVYVGVMNEGEGDSDDTSAASTKPDVTFYGDLYDGSLDDMGWKDKRDNTTVYDGGAYRYYAEDAEQGSLYTCEYNFEDDDEDGGGGYKYDGEDDSDGDRTNKNGTKPRMAQGKKDQEKDSAEQKGPVVPGPHGKGTSSDDLPYASFNMLLEDAKKAEKAMLQQSANLVASEEEQRVRHGDHEKVYEWPVDDRNISLLQDSVWNRRFQVWQWSSITQHSIEDSHEVRMLVSLKSH